MTLFQGDTKRAATKRPTWATTAAIGFLLIGFGMLVGTLALVTDGVGTIVFAVSGVLATLGAMFASFGAYIYFMEKR